MSVDRETLAFAVLFSAPVAVGVWLAFGKATGLPPTHPFVVGGGLLCAAGTFILVILGGSYGSVDPGLR